MLIRPTRAPQKALAACAVATAALLAGCAGTNNDPVLTPGPTGEATESTPAEAQTRFQSTCFFADGRLAGTFSSLNETWASTNYVRIDHCVTSYVGPPPFTLTEQEAAIAKIASSRLADPQAPEQLFLDIYAACTRIGSEDGPFGVASIPVPVLEATLSLCPEAPQANIIRDRISS